MATIPFRCESQPLYPADVQSAMDSLKADAAAIWAILTVESGKAGFLADRRPQILFERAKFHDRTQGQYDQSHPGISAPTWGGYQGGTAEYARLGEAYALHEEAALLSASWGMGQIMGFNYKLAGYATVTDFVREMCASEGAQLTAFQNFLVNSGIDADLANHDWKSVARKYNGSAQVDLYAGKLSDAHAKLSAPGGLPSLSVRASQMLLTFLAREQNNAALNPGAVDGQAGSRTMNAVNAFLATQGKSCAKIEGWVVDALTDALAPAGMLQLG